MRKERGKAPTDGLGRALVKHNALNQAVRRRDGRLATANYHQTDDKEQEEQRKLDSIMERNALDEFLNNAIMSEHDFSAQKANVVMVGGTAVVAIKPKELKEQLEYEHIRIPRRPKWDHSMAPDELIRLERESFLEWRRELALYEESSTDKHATPFEKNLEVWKQLWRVAERSHVIAQIVDARNPLLFYCADIFTMVKEIDPRKECILVINKADFLTREARVQWGHYFESQGIEFLFWSAKAETEEQEAYAQRHALQLDARDKRIEAKRNEQAKEARKIGNAFASLNFDDDDDEDVEYDEDIEYDEDNDDEQQDEQQQYDDDEDEEEIPDVYQEEQIEKESTRDQYDVCGHTRLLSYLKAKADPEYVKLTAKMSTQFRQARGFDPDPDASKVCIGLLGFPNVGKSSTINALIGAKRVSVASTPGHTKHFQTLSLGDDLMLCDCPGLVFPTFVHSRATLAVNGVIPIDTLRDFHGPIEVVCQHISRSQILQLYGLEFPAWKTMDAVTLLSAYCKLRSFYKQTGTYDEARAARTILKDFATGKLLYCQCPPGTTDEQRKLFYSSYRDELLAQQNQQQQGTTTTTTTSSSSNTELDFIHETEAMTNSHAQLMAKHRSLGDDSSNHVIDVAVTRTKTVQYTPETSDLTLGKSGKSYRDNINELSNKDLTKKQARRLNNALLKGKTSISNSGVTTRKSTANRMAGK